MDKFELRVTLLGPQETEETNYGPRTNRETLATISVPVSDYKGWRIYQDAIAAVLRPDTIISFDGLSAEEAERTMSAFKKRQED